MNTETAMFREERLLTKSFCSGFTLIELLVVVLIVGILSAVALPQYQTAVDKARYTQHLTLARNIKDAQERHYLANGSYTDSYEDLDIELPAGGTIKKIGSGSRMEYPDGFFYDMYTFYVVGGKPELARVVYGYDQGGYGLHQAGSRTCYGYNERQIRLCKALGGTLLASDADSSVFTLP